jgi:pilus assembly protein Flp/PilA
MLLSARFWGKTMQLMKAFWADESAATAVEYGLLLVVLSLVIVAGIGEAGDAIAEMFSNQDRELQKAFNQ